MMPWPMAAVGALAVLFAALMLAQRSLYTSAICLLVVLFQAAALFYLSGAPLLAFLQIMIYAGAVMVLIVVMVMAAPGPEGSFWSRLQLPRWAGWLGLLIPLAEVALALSRGEQAAGAPGALALQEAVGPFLFGPYAAATEGVTLLMFLAALALIEERPR